VGLYQIQLRDPIVNMVLLDWTRMGKSYCLAGAVVVDGQYRIVRPLLRKHRGEGQRKAGWSAYLLDGHSRWEIFTLIGAQAADPAPPHLEDLWVRAMKPLHRLASTEQRRAILAATMASPGETLFGVHLKPSRMAAYLTPGTGARSLATMAVPGRQIAFRTAFRAGAPEPDVRMELRLPGMEGRLLSVKDHHLLCRAEQGSPGLEGRADMLTRLVSQMGEQVALRLGLSRAFTGRDGRGPGNCWLMADGLFSLNDPQP
jgi:hypothetical protein